MRRLFTVVALAGFVIAAATAADASVQTIRGQLVDQACYKADKTNTGETHKMGGKDMENCATACAKMGMPVALVTSDGKVYQVTGDLAANKNEKLVAHMSHTVELTGDVSTAADGSMKIAATNLKMISK
jgi:hypothetical protein